MFDTIFPATVSLALIAATSFLVSCGSPADATTDAKVSDAVEKPKQEAGAAQGTRYEFVEGSSIRFVGAKLDGSTQEGEFKKFTGHFTIADGKPVGTDHRVEIDMDSTHTADEKLTAHLKNADFFDVPRFPTATYEVTQLTDQGNGKWEVQGNLNLHGVTKGITFPAEVIQEGDSVHISAKFDFDRKVFGVAYEGARDNAIQDRVVLELDLFAKPRSL